MPASTGCCDPATDSTDEDGTGGDEMTSPVTGVMTPYVTGTTGSTTGTAATTGTGSSSGSAGSSTKTDNSLLDPQAFLQLLVAQLQYQDPTKPVDTSAFLNQTATLTQVQSMTTMQDTLASLLGAQQAQSATAMIGKQVTYTDASGKSAQGVVTAASLFSGGATVQIGSTTVPLSSVTEVTNPSTAA
jgi:flagellar basal-body rod modification protein FlgD